MHDVAIFAGRARSRYFPVPFPDDFYSGNPEPVEGIGLLGDYFAFEWGDALFIALDPYWHSTRVTSPIGGMGTGTGTSPPWSEIVDQWNALTRSTGDMWDSTIGDAQYTWLKTTLEESDARYKFVFMHHVLGTGRGGIELATHDYGFFHFFCSLYDKAAMMVLAKDRVSDRRISRIFKTTRQEIDNGYQQTSLS